MPPIAKLAQPWVEGVLRDIKQALTGDRCPDHAEGCEEKIFLDGVAAALK